MSFRIQKAILLFLLISVLIIPASAQALSLNPKWIVTQPVTPITPITPVTPPTIAQYVVSGTVLYQVGQRTIPAANVTIEAVNMTGTGTPFTAKTNSSGNYKMLLKNGLYHVRAYDARKTVFNPPYRTVTVRNAGVTGVNFVGQLVK